ncbi:MAG: SGNH/GDSL hydrolase family protein, partial [Candidatus Aureabacteria bacterium]|nr:SGNH/GDSL hydrolase family protein [Candidatus Auribacterota bacterium]
MKVMLDRNKKNSFARFRVNKIMRFIRYRLSVLSVIGIIFFGLLIVVCGMFIGSLLQTLADCSFSPNQIQADLIKDKQLKQRHYQQAKEHPFGFNDFSREEKKPSTVPTRIIILGDSFVFGDGLENDQIWSHKLEKKIQAKYGSQVEVLHWGRCGWGTIDQLEFVEQHFKDKETIYDADLIILAFVTNDLDLKKFPGHPVRIYFRKVLWIEKLYPHFPLFFLSLEKTL